MTKEFRVVFTSLAASARLKPLAPLSGGSSRSLKTVTGQKFTRSVEVNIAAKPANFWESNMQIRNKIAIKKGDMVLASFFIRCNYAADATESCESYLSFKQHSDNGFIWGKSLKAGAEWRQYFIPITVDRDFAVDNFRVEFFFGYKVQKVEMAGFALINFMNKYKCWAASCYH